MDCCPPSSLLNPFCVLSALRFSGEQFLLCCPIHTASGHPSGEPSFSLILVLPAAEQVGSALAKAKGNGVEKAGEGLLYTTKDSGWS